MDPLQVLELKPGCSKEDAKKNFRRLSFLYHPDKHPNDKDAEESFKSIANAYAEIKKNPSLLDKDIVSSGDILYAELTVSIEDLYFNRAKSVSLKRSIPCTTCLGSGTHNIEKGICTLCGGLGQIDSNILNMLKKERNCFCPVCGGIGIKKEFLCPSCKGKKTQEETKTYMVELDMKDYQNKFIVITGKGSRLPDGSVGDVYIFLKIKKDPVYKIEGSNLCFEYTITPAQSLVGDTCEIFIFGKKFTFNIPTCDDTVVLEDNRKDLKHPQKILIRTLVKRSVLSKEVKELYKKIVKLEKESL
jgi:DnaJ-class molecular chaperone